jgi:hypothetical protein
MLPAFCVVEEQTRYNNSALQGNITLKRYTRLEKLGQDTHVSVLGSFTDLQQMIKLQC